MRDDTPSRTAQFVAAMRGLGRLLPDTVRIADDPYGLAFNSPGFADWLDRNLQGAESRAESIARLPVLSRWIVYMQVRTRLIDDAVRAFVAAGGRQVVLLGAGFDCRALRLPELAASQVYEIDHPATQRHKREVLERFVKTARSPEHRDQAHYLSWDFETRPMDDLPAVLAEAGHDPARPTLTIWEGVTVYLTEGAIDASLRAIATWSAPGSELAMNYMDKSPSKKPSFALRLVEAVARRVGEPFKFGWVPEQLPEYLEIRGWKLVRDVSIAGAARGLLPADLAAQMLRSSDRAAFARVTARVA